MSLSTEGQADVGSFNFIIYLIYVYKEEALADFFFPSQKFNDLAKVKGHQNINKVFSNIKHSLKTNKKRTNSLMKTLSLCKACFV